MSIAASFAGRSGTTGVTAIATADIPGPYLAAYQQAARSVEPPIPWEVLAGIGAAATDQGRRSPYDAGGRAQGPVYPDTTPPIVGAGLGPLLLTPAADAPAGADLQDIDDAAAVLARDAATIEERTWRQLGLPSAVASEPLADPAAQRFWSVLLPELPVATGVEPLVAADASTAAAVTSDAGIAGGGRTDGAGAGAGDAGAGVPGSGGGAGDPLARFDADLLASLGDPVTAADLAGLAAWASGEGSDAAYNPYDTTLAEPGSRAYNSNGGDPVRDYPDYRTGLAATVATLAPDGRPVPAYRGILAALRAGSSAAAVDAAVATSPWGTRHFPDPSFTATANFPGPVPGGAPVVVAPAGGPVLSGASAPTSGLAAALAFAGVQATASPVGAADGGGVVAGGAQPLGAGPAGAQAAAAVAFALAQLGKPYVLGATGPAAYDCSGLVQAAYRAAGVALPRTTYQQVAVGQAVPVTDPGAFAPGDLVFIMGADPEGGLPGHVGMVVGPGEVVDAPYTGAVVRITPLSTWVGKLVAVRRVTG